MTNREITAVKRTIKQWEWYIENPEARKIDYFTKHNLNYPNHFFCYLCSIWWDKDEHLVCNKKCPLATRTLICDKEIAPNNPYDRWNNYDSYTRIFKYLQKKEKVERIKQAKRIVGACKRWLKKYDIRS